MHVRHDETSLMQVNGALPSSLFKSRLWVMGGESERG